MRFATRLRTAAEHLTGWYIRKYPPLGLDKFHDMAMLHPPDQVRTVLDVGANVGQSAVEFGAHFQHAQIHSFEPVSSTFAQLQRTASGKQYHHYRSALGSVNEQLEMNVTTDPRRSDMNSVRAPHPYLAGGTFRKETIEVMTLDEWCKRSEVTSIDYLKIDTEGNDMEVLLGGSATLAKQHVRFIEVEVGMNPSNTFHVPLERIAAHLHPLGYHLFALYEQSREASPTFPVLRRANALFVGDRFFRSPAR